MQSEPATALHIYEGGTVRTVRAPAARPLRWAAWRPDGAFALLVGNRGQVLRFGGDRFDVLTTGGQHNLRGVGWSPDGARALLTGNRGAVLLYDDGEFSELPRVTDENLRRVAWSPDGSRALVAGNGGCLLRFDAASHALVPLPGDRAHTLRSIAWRPDGAYALVGGYASARAGYPPPHVLYRCDGRYMQAIVTTDDEDDAIAIDWHPTATVPRASVLIASYSGGASVRNKIVEYYGSGVSYRALEGDSTMLGLGWHPSGEWLLLCGEGGRLQREDSDGLTPIISNTNDNLVGPFWRPSSDMALMLKGPDEKVYTI